MFAFFTFFDHLLLMDGRLWWWSTVSRQENKEMFDLEKSPDKNRRKVSLGKSPRFGPYQHILKIQDFKK